MGVIPTFKGWIFQYLDTNTQGESCQAFFHEDLFLRKCVKTGDFPGARESLAPTGETGDPFTSVYNLPAKEDGEGDLSIDLTVELELDQVLVPPTWIVVKRFDLGEYDISGKRLDVIPEEEEEEEITASSPIPQAQVSFSRQDDKQVEEDPVFKNEPAQEGERQEAELPTEVAEILQDDPMINIAPPPEEQLAAPTEMPVESPF